MADTVWKPGVTHPAIIDEVDAASAKGPGRCARVRTALGVVPCWEGDTIMGDGETADVHRPDGTAVTPPGPIPVEMPPAPAPVIPPPVEAPVVPAEPPPEVPPAS